MKIPFKLNYKNNVWEWENGAIKAAISRTFGEESNNGNFRPARGFNWVLMLKPKELVIGEGDSVNMEIAEKECSAFLLKLHKTMLEGIKL